jgi:molybdenum cofactor synthesis domain-containing protein
MIDAAVLTISDSVHAGVREDRSGPAVRERLEQLGWRVAAMEMVPDDTAEIAARLATLADGGQVSAIFTTGGTGVSARDNTPEATRAVVEREIPGIGELMRQRGREQTPMAALSRAVAGVRGRVLIVNLPGSVRGAVESLDAIVELVPHVLELLRGQTEHAAAPERAVGS